MNSGNKELARLNILIGLIYEGATDPSRWTKDILPAVAEYFQASECILFTNLHTPQNGGYFFIHGITQDRVDLYVNKYHSHDVLTSTALEKNALVEGNITTGDEPVPSKQLFKSKIYKRCLFRDKNMAQLMVGMLFGLDSSNAMPTALSLFRGLPHPDFNEDERARLLLVLPHLSCSLGMMQRLKSAVLFSVSSLAALDHLSHGILLLNGSGIVAFANRVAKRILEDADGMHLGNSTQVTDLGPLLIEDVTASSAVSNIINAILCRSPYHTQHFSKCVLVPRPSGLTSYSLQLSSLGQHDEFATRGNEITTIVFINDAAQGVDIHPGILQSTYGLTTAEAKVALALLVCSSAQEVAGKLGTSPNTVSTQIKHIYAKLGVDTRTRFVRLLLGLALQRA